MTYTEIFQEIGSIMAHDSATYPDYGAGDYSNVNMVEFDDFKLTYPTSRDTRIDHGKGLLQRGVPVDVYIPWKPENIGKDVELIYVLNQIEAGKQ